MDKVYLLIAGVNGAGKTSLYNIYLDLRRGRRVNSDEICRDNGWDWRNPADSFRAGKIAAKPARYVAIKNDILLKSAAVSEDVQSKSPAERAMEKLFSGKANDAKKEYANGKANDEPCACANPLA